MLPSKFLEFLGGEGAPTDADSVYFCLQNYRDYEEAPFLFEIVVKMYGAVEHIVAVAHPNVLRTRNTWSVFLLMNKLLLQIGSSLSIMRDVSLFDARVPLSEIVAAVIDGQRVVTEGDWPEVEEEAK